jgi:TolB-like protein/Tfp pilus assembly protein PilF
MVAVLPFVFLGGAAGSSYLAEGLTEEMIGQLGRWNPEALGVIASTTATQYARREKTVSEIAAELNVQYVVEGSVRQESERVRVTARLIEAADQALIWSGTYEQLLQSILVLERDLARDIVHEIRVTLLPLHQRRLDTPPTVKAEAYQAYLEGRHFLNAFTPRTVQRSVHLFQTAIQADPAFAAAYASLAEAYQQLPIWTDQPPGTTLSMALEAAEHALRLDRDLPDAHTSLGLINACYLWNWDKAEWFFRRALELNPGCSPARQWYAEYLAEMGRIDEALTILDGALIHDPLSHSIRATRAFVSWLGRRFDDAVDQARAVLELHPDYPMALIRLGVGCLAKGRYDDAIQAFDQASKAAPELLDCVSLLAHAHGRAGRKDEARRHLAALESLGAERYVPAFLLANVHLGLDDHDTAIQCMEREYAVRGWYLLLIKQAPLFDPLRSHPRFQALVRRMRFPDVPPQAPGA